MERTFDETYAAAHPDYRSRTLDGRRSVLALDKESGATVLLTEKATQIKPGSLVVWGLVSKEVHAEVQHSDAYDRRGYDAITRRGYQIAKLWNTGLLVAVRPLGGAQRWGETVTRVAVREITTEVKGDVIVAGLGKRLQIRNPVTRNHNLNQ